MLDKVYGRGRMKKNPEEIPEDKSTTGDLGKDIMSFDSKQTISKMEQLNFLRIAAKLAKKAESSPEVRTPPTVVNVDRRADEILENDSIFTSVGKSKHISRILDKFSITRDTL